MKKLKLNLSFFDACKALEDNLLVKRFNWDVNVCLTKRLDSAISPETVKNIASFPPMAKKLMEGKTLVFKNQFIKLIIESNHVRGIDYSPTCDDVLANDWAIVEPD